MLVRFVQKSIVMTGNNVLSLICFAIVIGCFGTFFLGYYVSPGTVILGPISGLIGFIFSVAAIRSKQQRGLSWILFGLQTIVVLTYLSGAIYIAFFWNPRFF